MSTTDANNNEPFGDKVERLAGNCGKATGLCCFKVKEHSQITMLEGKITARQKKFGVEYLNLIERKAPQAELKRCLKDAMDEISELQTKVNDHYENIDSRQAETDEKIVLAPGESKPAKPSSKPTRREQHQAHSKDNEESPQSPSNKKKPTRRKPPEAAAVSPGGKKTPVSPGVKKQNVSPGGKKKPVSSRGKKTPVSPAKTKKGRAPVKIEKVPEEYRDADPSKWRLKEFKFQGGSKYDSKGKEESITGKPIQGGLDKFKANPGTYTAILYQTAMLTENWPASNCKYTLVHREGTVNYRPTGTSPSGWMTCLLHEYERLPPFKDNQLPKANRDKYTDSMVFQGRKLHNKKNLPILPGRGMGVGDTPLLKIIGDVDPSDINQGQVGDCWLLSGISGLAEFDGAIKRLFRKTKDLDACPKDGPNMYTVTLWDLPTWKEVDIHIDERLPCGPNGQGLLASKPSEDGELWVPLLEKALAVHCGGWDKIVGGQCTHAWALMTGCKEQYSITLNPKTGKYKCFGKYHPLEKRWVDHGNSPHEGDPKTYPSAWPKVGGGGDLELELTSDELFTRMVAWDKQNYIVGAGTKGTSDKHSTGGLVDNHAYTVIESHSNVAGTGIDLLKVRNPWGNGEIEDGEFDDDGPGWDKYPQIKKLLNPVVADDGIFWVTKQEFFHFYQTIFLSASDMTEFLED